MSFSVDIGKFVQKCSNNMDSVTRKTVLDIGTRLVNRTPVGDATYWKSKPPAGYVGGHARANWQHSAGGLNAVEHDTIDGNTWEGDNVSKDRITGSLAATRKGEDTVHYISNSVPYIQALEDGHSRQAPNGIVSLTAVEFQGIVNSIAGGLK